MIIVTAATGQYGRLVIDALLRRGVPAGEIVAAVRDPHKATELAQRGVQVREADYDRPATLAPAFAGADKLLLIPSAVFGQRYPQMQHAVKAAAAADVGLLAYAGFVNTDTATSLLWGEHQQTEALIRDTGLPSVMLRNGAYIEMYTSTLGPALEHGVILGSAGDGKISGASRADLAEAAATVLSGDGPTSHAGKVYELGGPGFTMADLATEATRQTGKTITYQDLPVDDYAKALTAAGIPEAFAGLLADTSHAIALGEWHTDSADLVRLLGRWTTPMADVLAATLNAGLSSGLDPRG